MTYPFTTAVIKTVHKLRAPNGCPWDREQTHSTLKKHLIEETYEVCDAVDELSAAELKEPALNQALKDELGDLLLQVLLHSAIAEERGSFSFEDVCQNLNEKLIRRHPHVFGDVKVADSTEVLKNWDAIKKTERNHEPATTSILDSLPRSMPPLERTEKIISKVSKVGFQWDSMEGPLAKMEEELAELKEALDKKVPHDIENELGDVIFCSINLANVAKFSAEGALRACLKKFERRFRYVEQEIAREGKTLGKVPLSVLDQYWDKAKKQHESHS